MAKSIKPHHKQSISERYREAVKANDVDGMDLFKAIRKRAYELGYTEEQLQEVYREVRNESSRDKQHTESVPEPKPAATEEVQELPKLQKETKQLRRDIPPRARAGKVSPSGTTITGASGGKSIVDGIL